LFMWWSGLLLPSPKTQQEVNRAKKKTAKSLTGARPTEPVGDSDDSLHLDEHSQTADERISLIEIEEESLEIEEEEEEKVKLSPGDDVRQRIKELRASARTQSEASDDGDNLDKRIDDLFSRRSKES